MRWSKANEVVELLRQDSRLWLPALSQRRGFSSSRVEHLLNGLVAEMPVSETYFEVGVLEGRTLEAASVGNGGKRLVGCDPCEKYGVVPEPFGPNVVFYKEPWHEVLPREGNIGLAFYDGDHQAEAVHMFMLRVRERLANEAVLVLDDWDRVSVRSGAFEAAKHHPEWRLLREMPEYTDGLTTAPHHFGYQFGVAVWGWRREN